VGLTGKRQAAIEYGVGALAGGVTRFVFGRDVIDASRAHRAIPVKSKARDDSTEEEPNRALAALADAADATGNWFAYTANTVGGAVVVGTAASATDTVTRPFRSVDIDGTG
jgi:hypothetical protein